MGTRLPPDHERPIDTTFDVRSDAGGRDPDSHSATLKRYHRRLWSKRLPDERWFDLTDDRPDAYLYHRAEVGEFFLSSDSVIPTYTGRAALRPLLDGVPLADREAFLALAYTVGGMMLFPGNVVDGKQTLNGARGFHPRIADRMDLTLECIRRHYRREDSPLAGVLGRYSDFFELFGHFRGYVDFWLLQDLLEEGADRVRFLMAFDDFTTPAVPWDLPTYRAYQHRTVEFLHARNERIAAWDAATP